MSYSSIWLYANMLATTTNPL